MFNSVDFKATIDNGILKIIEKIMISNGRLEYTGNTQKELLSPD